MSTLAAITVVEGYVPVIDVGAATSPDLDERKALADVIAGACETSGFFVITNHGVPTELVERMQRVTLEFFALDAAVKDQYAVDPGDVTIRGYFKTPSYVAASEDIETPPDLCQLYTVCRLGEPGVGTPESLGEEHHETWSQPNVWPAELPEFKETWLEYYRVLEDLAADLMRLFALGLDLAEDFFEDKIDDHITNLVANHYPALSEEPLPGQWRKGPHSDWGTLTILHQDDTGGLEVLDRDNDRWLPVPIVAGSFVVNVGDLMEVWTNNRWRSTKHRVPAPPAEARSTARVSMPFFHQPNWLAEVECLPSCLVDGEEPLHQPVTSGQYLLDKIRMTYT